MEKTQPSAESLDIVNAADCTNSEGRTCLHVAALKNNLPLATYLVEQQHANKRVLWHYRVNALSLLYLVTS